MRCPNCECEVSEMAHFCPQCGSELETTFCSVCGKEKGGGGGSKIDKFVFAILIAGVIGWLAWAWMETQDNKGGEVTAAVQPAIEVVVPVEVATEEKVAAEVTEPEIVEENVPVEEIEEVVETVKIKEDRFAIVEDEKLPETDKATHNLKAVVGPNLDQTELAAIAHAILDERIATAPEDVFVLSIFDGDPSGDALLPEQDARFVAKFLYLNRLHSPGESIPSDFVEIGSNFFAKWK